MSQVLGGEFATYQRTSVPWPEQAVPVTGSTGDTLTESVAVGVNNLNAAINTALTEIGPGEHVTVVGLSAGALVADGELALLAELACFFEGRGQNPRAEIVRKTHAALAEALAIVGEKVDGLDPVKTVRAQAAKQEAASTAGSTSGKPPDALASPLLL